MFISPTPIRQGNTFIPIITNRFDKPNFDVTVSMATDINTDPQDFAKPSTTLIISKRKQSAQTRVPVFTFILNGVSALLFVFY